MKDLLISCISAVDEKRLLTPPHTYISGDVSVSAHQTNEACMKYLMMALPNGRKLDEYIRVQSALVASEGNPAIKFLNEETERFCESNGFAVPKYCDIFLGEDEKTHRYDRVLSEISKEVQHIAKEDSEISIHLDMAGGKRDNYIFIQLLTKLLSYYGYEIHTYYADITGEIVNTDLSFAHMEILDAVNEFVRYGYAARLRALYANTRSSKVKTLLKTMQELSDSIQICSTDIAEKLDLLDQQLEQVEKNVTDDSNGLFVIKTMIPLIRSKFHITGGSGKLGIIGITRWCLENHMVQQALTIYNENIADIIIEQELISIDKRQHSNGINSMIRNKNESYNVSLLLYVLGKVFDNMEKARNTSDKSLNAAISKYRKKFPRATYDNRGNRKYHNKEWTIAAIFFDEKYLPEGVTLGTSSENIRKIMSDCRFAVSARNRVNHASIEDTNDKLLISLFSTNLYPFSSYPNTFTPKNITKDMLRAVENIDKALAEKIITP